MKQQENDDKVDETLCLSLRLSSIHELKCITKETEALDVRRYPPYRIAISTLHEYGVCRGSNSLVEP